MGLTINENKNISKYINTSRECK